MTISLYIVLGLAAGVLSGLIGVGGGIIIIPSLVFFFGLSQHQAQGTTLATLVPPIGILAAWKYYSAGYVDLKIAAFVCIGFVIGGLLGANIATDLSNDVLRKIFGVVLLITGTKMILGK
ncbi:MAG TPA: sulfite exporter TauE/SafE family protein [Bacteroidota bacterium]|nr:sulfite exporter TauE/SafE family protein [Bacteroidota bacterium]